MSTSTLSGAQKSVRNKLGGYLDTKLDGGSSYYNQPLTAPLLPGLQQMGQQLGGYDPSQYNGLAGQGLQSAMQNLYGGQGQQLGPEPASQQIGLDPVTNYWKQSTLNPMMRQFHNVIKPQIKASYAGQSGFSSREGNQIAGAYGDTINQAQQQLGNMQNQVLGQNAQMDQNQIGRQNQRDILNASGSMQDYSNQISGSQAIGQQAIGNAMAPVQQGSAMAQALNPLQANANLGAQNQYQDWIRTQKENNPWMQLALQYMGQRNTLPTQPQNPWAVVAGAALPIAFNAFTPQKTAQSQTQNSNPQTTNGYDSGGPRFY